MNYLNIYLPGFSLGLTVSFCCVWQQHVPFPTSEREMSLKIINVCIAKTLIKSVFMLTLYVISIVENFHRAVRWANFTFIMCRMPSQNYLDSGKLH